MNNSVLLSKISSFANEAEEVIHLKKPTLSKEKEHRVLNQPGFVLHSYPYKETSLLLDFFSRDYGRVTLVAKGAKRPHSALRSVLQTFQPLSVSWSGKSELRTLTAAEWVGGMLPLEKTALLCGFYLNELIVKLFAKEDTITRLFDYYVATLNALGHGENALKILRKFEYVLLKEAGIIADLTFCTTTQEKIVAHQIYVVEPLGGVRLAVAEEYGPKISGQTLLDIMAENYEENVTQMESKTLMRFLLSYHLAGVKLNTRQILVDLLKLEGVEKE